MAQRCAHGVGVPRDYMKAVAYLRRSANQGYAPAQTSLGSCYAHGLGVKQDYGEAVRWYRKAAVRGDSLAEYSLGYAYAHGKGVTKDVEAAIKWWQKSAEQGQVYAQNAWASFTSTASTPATPTTSIIRRPRDGFARLRTWVCAGYEHSGIYVSLRRRNGT